MIIKNRSMLLVKAKSEIVVGQEEPIYTPSYYTYLANDDDVAAGMLVGCLLPFDSENGYYSYILISKDGRVCYGTCVYDFETEVLSFTGWYNIVAAYMDEFQDSIDPDYEYIDPDEEED